MIRFVVLTSATKLNDYQYVDAKVNYIFCFKHF